MSVTLTCYKCSEVLYSDEGYCCEVCGFSVCEACGYTCHSGMESYSFCDDHGMDDLKEK